MIFLQILSDGCKNAYKYLSICYLVKKSESTKLTPISEILRDRANLLISLYQLKDEKEFYDNVFNNIINMIQRDNYLIGIDACFLIPYILINNNFTFVHTSQISKFEFDSYEEIIESIIKKYFSFLNTHHLRHLIEYFFPYLQSNFEVVRNGKTISYKIRIDNNIDKNVIKYSFKMIDLFIEILNLGKIVYEDNFVKIEAQVQEIIDFSKHNQHGVRISDKTIFKRDDIVKKFMLNINNPKSINNIILYQALNIFEILYKKNLFFYDVLYRLSEIYDLFVELRKTSHILAPRTSTHPEINYRALDIEIMKRNIELLIYLIDQKLKLIRINPKELIIYPVGSENSQYILNFLHFIFGESAKIESNNNFVRLRIDTEIFLQ
ncbi:hypothetical protein DMP16_08630 [Sulfolobus sp. B1]|nr:hypothetical protein DJ523_03855 [Sulfolobus sp. E5]TRM78735.1 hypothetical protein DJ532_00270 [Sulfolobus sp. A20-N-F8]TRM85504.1 hypothetical protein DJ522_00485 [Sulfolobus sp. F3]TRM95524.1 hypothetical protein DJ526_00075 [Sulfolobus sp. A20-N-G8]TRM95568.1 hypothetical protein DMP16_08630 [Sulfolobus sp. B1]TRN01409.1 hypothetical protein DJ530_05915 [Sulfolobus sp. E1]